MSTDFEALIPVKLNINDIAVCALAKLLMSLPYFSINIMHITKFKIKAANISLENLKNEKEYLIFFEIISKTMPIAKER